MWLSPKIFSILEVAKDSVDALRQELAVVKAERDLLKDQLRGAQINSDFFRLQINSLQMERAALLEKAHGISVPVPQLERRFETPPEFQNASLLDDMGDELARKFGFPAYDDKQ